MPTFRIHIDQYVEGEYLSEEEAVTDFLEWLNDYFDSSDLIIEKFNEQTGEWE